MIPRSCNKKTTKRKGQAAIELALTMPFFVLVVFGIFETSRLMYTKHMIDMAVREGARAGVILSTAAEATTKARDITRNLLASGSLNTTVVTATAENVSGINVVRVAANFTYQPTNIFPAVILKSESVMRQEG